MPKKFSKTKFLYRALKYRFVEDKAELDYITQSVNPGDFVLDIGAHKGGYLHWLRKSVGDQGQIVAFEPQPSLYNYIKEAIAAYGYQNITLHHAGVSSQKGKLNLFIPKAEGLTSPGATFEDRPHVEGGHSIEVPVLQIDEVLEGRSEKVSLIKIDVEGHELEVFKGAEALLKTDQPKLIFECENRHLNHMKVEDVFNYLKQLNYKGYFFNKGKRVAIEEFDANQHQAIDEGKEIINKKAYCNNFVFEPTSS
ncbi:FkbM family methyltransferase [Roseivirga sp.]|uniref:FkbM family methyltransferase n=1 Tax=Roseivirga sp. TaxID=1964215 RepID=UPI003B51DB52